MARPRLRSPNQSLPVQLVLGCYEFLASLQLAVVLILTLAIVLGAATILESIYDRQTAHGVAKFLIYNTWWFGALNALLAINIFCAAAIRFPWKRHQTGFVVTHIGLLVLLAGCLQSWYSSIDAQIPILENYHNNVAFDDRMVVRVEVTEEGDSEPTHTVDIPFRGGPFNWQDYRGMSTARSLLFSQPQRDVGPLDTPDGKLEELGIYLSAEDYHSDSERIAVPRVRLHLSSPIGKDGQPLQGEEVQWSEVNLAPNLNATTPLDRWESQRVGGGSITFWMVEHPTAVKSFLAKPDAKLGYGLRGQVVLAYKNETLRLLVDDKLNAGSFAWEGTPLEVEVVDYQNFGDVVGSSARVQVRDRQSGKTTGLVLFSSLPQVNQYTGDLNVYGSYWVDQSNQSKEALMRGRGGQRIDLIQGPDLKLYYRLWNRKEVVVADEMPTDQSQLSAFEMPHAKVKMYVAPGDFIPSQEIDQIEHALPYHWKKAPGMKRKAVKLRLKADGDRKDFWVSGQGSNSSAALQYAKLYDGFDGDTLPAEADQEEIIRTDDRTIRVTFHASGTELGSPIRLDQFEMKLDPGTSQPSSYASYVDFLDSDLDPTSNSLEDVRIGMNAPVDVTDPKTGRLYRFFQESYNEIETPEGEKTYYSILTVNYDPGRGVKYLGCALIVLGIAIMFYMRAYFFKNTKRQTA